MGNSKRFLEKLDDKLARGKISIDEYKRLKNIFYDTNFRDTVLSYLANQKPDQFTDTESEKKYWLEAGNKNHESGQYPESIICYHRSITIDPDYENAWYNLLLVLKKIPPENLKFIFRKNKRVGFKKHSYRNSWISSRNKKRAIIGIVACFIFVLFVVVPSYYPDVSPAPEIAKTQPVQTTYTSPAAIATARVTTIPTTIPTTFPPDYRTGATPKQFTYILNGVSHTISLTMYSGIANKLSSQKQPVWCTRYSGDTSPCTDQESEKYYLAYINDPIQDQEISHLVSSIKQQTSNKNEQAKIAIRLVQKLDYDTAKSKLDSFDMRYPYATLYDKTGVCGEKSILLADLLSKLGFDLVLFNFNSEKHMAVGIKCDPKYAYKGTGYCFIESTTPDMITHSKGDYIGVGELTSIPDLYHISSGLALSDIDDEYNDAIRYENLPTLIESKRKLLEPYTILAASNGNMLGQQQYVEWKVIYSEWELLYNELQALNKKYGIRESG